MSDWSFSYLSNPFEMKKKKEKVIEDYRLGKTGKLVAFGKWPDINSEILPIEWRVLTRRKDRMLLFAETRIDTYRYNDEYDTSVTWETCSLRKWLNNKFYKTAFDEKEKSVILESLVKADKNPKAEDVNQGNDTMDKVFLLSILEAEKYFKYDGVGLCKWGIDACEYRWWLRSIGKYHGSAAYVAIDGYMEEYGTYVDCHNAGHISGYEDFLWVRPAIWLKLDTEIV